MISGLKNCRSPGQVDNNPEVTLYNVLIFPLFFLFTCSRGLPMRTTWPYTNTSMRWHWNLDQPGQTLSLLQVCLCDAHTALLFLFVKYPFPAIKWRLFSIPQHQWAPTIIPLLGIFSSHNLKKSSSIDTFSAKCESVTWNSYFCSFFFARPDTYSHPLPKELRGGRSVQWAGQLLWARRGWQESKELCKKGLVLLLLSVFFMYVRLYVLLRTKPMEFCAAT